MKELDVLLLRWLDSGYPQADERQRELFSVVLAQSDPQLVRWLLAGERPQHATLAALIDAIASSAPASPEYYVST